MARPRILLLDAYDSFSNNITGLLTTLLDVDVFVLPIDSPLLDPTSPGFRDTLRRELSHYVAVVCGPGPGSAAVGQDVGLMRYMWTLTNEDMLPVLGICLGFQSLVAAFGGTVRRLNKGGLHGMVREVLHLGSESENNGDIFGGVEPFKATLYHSLCVDIGQDGICSEQWETSKWICTNRSPDLIPLAWVEEKREAETERILMAVRHITHPFWGLQYHPESVCTEDTGHQVVGNWFREAVRWNRETGRRISTDNSILAGSAMRHSLLSSPMGTRRTRRRSDLSRPEFWKNYGVGWHFCQKMIELPTNVQVPDLVEIVSPKGTECIILDSANAHVPLPKAASGVRGRYSIIALDVQESLRMEYCVGDSFATAKAPKDHSEKIPLAGYPSIWHFLAEFHEARRLEERGLPDSPFLGGFMGYVTYEMGLAGIGVGLPSPRIHRRPDICFAWITKSLVVDHKKGLIHIQNLIPHMNDETLWIDSVVMKLQSSYMWHHGLCSSLVSLKNTQNSSSRHTQQSKEAMGKTSILAPAPAEYEGKVRLCQEYIAAGESYELCLTDQTTVTLETKSTQVHIQPSYKRRTSMSRTSNSWQLYKALRTRQPAPFASYIRLGDVTLISSSPERFLEYDRNGLCSMKPMKGTVRKSDAVKTLEEAEQVLHVPKEEAENLMIVDLVRHDLHGICGPGNVSVPQLMKVEEYQSVFQMITVVEGQLPSPRQAEEHRRYTGLDVLAASLPPGSMTGAPKKRSCEILQRIEGHKERGLYSGVVGYMCISGRGDWSVTIRSMFRWDEVSEKREQDNLEIWNIGAGGAVTILSTPEGEREEMFTKLAGPLGVFTDTEQF